MTNIQDLRKIYSAQGIKGFSSANRATFTADFEAAWDLAIAEDAARKPVKPVSAERKLAEQAGLVAPATPKKGICEDCGRKVGKSGHPTLCVPCFDYAGWENTHNDAGHAKGGTEDAEFCPVCHPELDPRTAKKAGRSRAGMVIVAKGTEIHKSATFKAAAEAAGWSVNVLGYVTENEDEESERYVATATKGEDTIELAWNGRAYDYPTSSAHLNGKSRKVRNLKEALRLL